VPEEIIKQYYLCEKVDNDGYLYIQVQKGMYGLPQAGILAQELLKQRLNKHGYFQNKAIPELWTHQTRPISFTLVVDDFGIKYVGQEHMMHLISILKEHYKLSEDWKGTKFIGLTLKWDYSGRKVHISMPGYIDDALTHFHHERPKRRHRILHISTLHPTTGHVPGMPSLKNLVISLTRWRRLMSRQSLALCCTMRERLIQLF
jgi:hypothetical protein